MFSHLLTCTMTALYYSYSLKYLSSQLDYQLLKKKNNVLVSLVFLDPVTISGTLGLSSKCWLNTCLSRCFLCQPGSTPASPLPGQAAAIPLLPGASAGCGFPECALNTFRPQRRGPQGKDIRGRAPLPPTLCSFVEKTGYKSTNTLLFQVVRNTRLPPRQKKIQNRTELILTGGTGCSFSRRLVRSASCGSLG